MERTRLMTTTSDSECGQGIVNKPWGLPSHPGQAFKDITCPGYDDLFLLGAENRLLSFKCEKV